MDCRNQRRSLSQDVAEKISIDIYESKPDEILRKDGMNREIWRWLLKELEKD